MMRDSLQQTIVTFIRHRYPDCCVEHHATITSTNDRCFELLEEGHQTAVVLADHQTNGRGRMGRSFFSPTSGIYLTVGFLVRDNLEQLSHLTAHAAVAVLQMVDQVTKTTNAQIKWVNDIYLHHRKIAGILVQTEQSQQSPENWKVIIGIGINLVAPEEGFPEDLQTKAGALFDSTINDKQKTDCVITLLAAFDEWLDLDSTLNMEALNIYRERQLLSDKVVNYQYDRKEYTGRVIGIDEHFRLIIQSETGLLHTLDSGEVHILNWQ